MYQKLSKNNLYLIFPFIVQFQKMSIAYPRKINGNFRGWGGGGGGGGGGRF